MAAVLLVLVILSLGLLVASATAAKPGKVIRDQRVLIKKQRQTIKALRAQVAADWNARVALSGPADLWRVVHLIATRIEALNHEDYTVASSTTTFGTYLGETFAFSWSGFNPEAALP
jgi:hypothetical protein